MGIKLLYGSLDVGGVREQVLLLEVRLPQEAVDGVVEDLAVIEGELRVADGQEAP